MLVVRVKFLVIVCMASIVWAGSGEVAFAEQSASEPSRQGPAWPDQKKKEPKESPWPGEQQPLDAAKEKEKPADEGKQPKPEKTEEETPSPSAKSDSPWPEFLPEPEAPVEPIEHCIVAATLPKATELARVEFDPYATDAPTRGESAQILKVVARSTATTNAPLYLLGTSFNPSEKPARLRELALKRAKSVAQALNKLGIEETRLTCVPKTGKRSPSKKLDRVVVIYLGAATSE